MTSKKSASKVTAALLLTGSVLDKSLLYSIISCPITGVLNGLGFLTMPFELLSF
ncbi:hypothetical protein [Oceanobacillus timonensis]|uniref:hypothetical protein n=1 Tax=Oceanobacillus timonensis TaxID=1926285 RepID=UPI0015C4954B|nr:hypothetical protein [Oceanobacillus timonensis]